MKKVLLIIFTIVIIVSLTIPCFASFTWNNITGDRYAYVGNEGLDSTSIQFTNTINDSMNEHLFNNSVTVYIRLLLYADSTFPLADIPSTIPYKPIREDAYNQKNAYDVTSMLSFGLDNSLKPTRVYFLTKISTNNVNVISPSANINSNDYWFSKDWRNSIAYKIEEKSYFSGWECVLRYDIPYQTMSNKDDINGDLAFGGMSRYIDFTPVLPNHLPYIGYVCCVPTDIFIINNKTQQYIPRENIEQNNYYVINSTNIFTPMVQISDLYRQFDGLRDYQYLKYTNYDFTIDYAFLRANNTRAGITKTMDTMRFGDLSTDDGLYSITGFQFDNIQSSLYGVHLDGRYLKYARSRVGSTTPSTGYFMGYQYSCNMANSYSCSAFQFSVSSFVSYDELFIAEDIYTDGNNDFSINIDDFYKSTKVKFSTEEGLLQGLSQFFADLFTQTLPNIVNNFIVWFMCESPLISTVTRPIFLIANLTVNYTLQWLPPLITGAGVFGVIIFVIFIVKRLVPMLGGNKDD